MLPFKHFGCHAREIVCDPFNNRSTYIKSPRRPAPGVHFLCIRHRIQLVFIKMVAIHRNDYSRDSFIIESPGNLLGQS
jgi:hypothetical protein